MCSKVVGGRGKSKEVRSAIEEEQGDNVQENFVTHENQDLGKDLYCFGIWQQGDSLGSKGWQRICADVGINVVKDDALQRHTDIKVAGEY